MSFFLKQAINALTTQTSDLQAVLDLKADADQTYTKTAVNTKLSDLISTAPATLDTLNELATALNDEANFASDVTKRIGDKVRPLL